MKVNRHNFNDVVARLSVSGQYGLDTETTGLRLSDRAFSVIFSDSGGGYYFNFQPYPGLSADLILPREWLPKLCSIVENPESTFFIHNAKFDLSMLSREGVEVLGTVHCTLAVERVLRNDFFDYSLEECAARRGLQKDGTVDAYISANKLYTDIHVPGKDKPMRLKHFDRVPYEIIAPYGENDAVLHRAIGLDQLAKLKILDDTAPTQAPKLAQVLTNERALTKVCYRMEREGILIDRPYVEKALAHTMSEARRFRNDFHAMTGMPYENSPKLLRDAFLASGVELPLTPKGKPCTNKEVLEALDNPLADKIREIRGAEKLASTYYSSFLYFADDNDHIHANMRQGGTETSRFSYSDPNLQNLSKEDEPEDRDKPYLVRKSFIPEPGFCFVPIDYKQQEFRMMLDYAGEHGLIAEIMRGADVHEATASLVGTTRKRAKTINFGLLYGMGISKLARALGITLAEAQELRANYFAKLPNVQILIRQIQNNVIKRGYIWNWFGFRNHCINPEFAYKIPNHLIQGGCGQVLRVAMVRLDEYIRRHRLHSRMLVQVHDELLFQVHHSELHHVPEFQKIMEGVYKPRNGLYLHCSVEHSWKSWGKFDQIPGLPLAA